MCARPSCCFSPRSGPAGCETIAPALLAGKIVLSDRFLDSSTVYQESPQSRGDPVAQINLFAVGNVMRI